ncbi:MAG: tRNA uridine-5-carboxymethylaminomethyl(34) synthesis GTPase MnmE [Gammaproteobacteria bacterium]|nr:tRNA uridine-5-carboxymethylaminomethyl(34) synthesis GTPase MnmE [Gammaproteobacteria bacterium]
MKASLVLTNVDTIAALATPAGRGGVAVIRVSGPNLTPIINGILQRELSPRIATFCDFLDEQEHSLDQGIAIFFPAPHSFTGENVLELQGHGGPVVVQQILQRIFQLGARPARPGEFSERAFLNEKIDLAQAESIADLINANSVHAARAAMHSLQGEFSQLIHVLLESLIQLRSYVEAALDFSEEEIDFLGDHSLVEKIDVLISCVDEVLSQAKQGALLQEGMTIVIAGKPNAGKSSLLNRLSGRESAIVTDIPGTTRDVLREDIQIDGLPLHIVDTAGLRESQDKVEKIGIERAQEEIKKADRLLWIVDAKEEGFDPLSDPFFISLQCAAPLTLVYNKIDLIDKKPELLEKPLYTEIMISAKTAAGIDLLKKHLKSAVGYHDGEGKFIARIRHVDALKKSRHSLEVALKHLQAHRAGELVAEELRYAQKSLSEITGEFTNEDLLGRIFSSFCVGK